MAFCTKCGKQVDDGAMFCAGCGAKLSASAADSPAAGTSAPSGGAGFSTNNITAMLNTPDETASMDPADIAQNKVFAILAYIGILILVPIFAAKDSKFARYHANQALPLLIVGVGLGILGGFIAGAMSVIGLGLLAFAPAVIFGILSLVPLAGAIYGIVNAATGKAKEIPFSGKFRFLP